MNMMTSPPPYPVDAMYAQVRDAVREVQNQVQAPDALVAGSFLTGMSTVCQGNVDVLLPTGQLRPANLYIAMFGGSGERKTAVDGLVNAAILEYDKQFAPANAEAAAHYEAKLRIWEAKSAALNRKLAITLSKNEDPEQFHDELMAHVLLKPSRPATKCILHQSITERPLLEALHGDGKHIAILSDEGEIVLKGGAMDKPGFLNKGWDGGPSITMGRSDDHLRATNPRVTVSFMIQPELFEEFWRKRGRRTRGSGHMARYLVAWPASTVGFRRMLLQEHTWSYLPLFHKRATELLVMADHRQSHGQPRTLLEFSTDAKELWVDAQNWIEVQMRPGELYSGIKDFASKSLEIAGRIAAIFHYFSGLEGQISKETLHRALQVVGWHLNEFNRLFGDAHSVPQLQRDVAYLRQHLLNHYWRQGQGKASWNHVRTHNGSVRNQQRFEAAMQQLWQEGTVQFGQEHRGRSKGKRYVYLNPHQFQQAALA